MMKLEKLHSEIFVGRAFRDETKFFARDEDGTEWWSENPLDSAVVSVYTNEDGDEAVNEIFNTVAELTFENDNPEIEYFVTVLDLNRIRE